jgi:competence protein ComEC
VLRGAGGRVGAPVCAPVCVLAFLVALLATAACEPADAPLTSAPGAVEVGAPDGVPTTTPETRTPTPPPEQAATPAAAAAESVPSASPSPQAAPRAPPAVGEPLRVTFIDVGQGDATLLQVPGATLLIDTGRHDRSDLVPALRVLGVEVIDVVVITHGHADHIGQLDTVLQAFSVGEVWMSGTPHTTLTFERALAALEASDARYEEPRAGDSTALGPLLVEVLNPARLTGDLHRDSLALRVTFGSVGFLFTGDAEQQTESEMLARDAASLRADVYQVGHHGSRTSTSPAFLTAVSPHVAVYSAGAGNSFGHPHPEVVDRLLAAGVTLYGTDVHGSVTVVTDGESWDVATVRGAPPVGAASGTAPPTPTPALSPSPPPAPTGTATATATPSPPAPAGSCAPGQVDINSAGFADLELIIHIGPARAQAIIDLRPFASVDDLIRVSGIGSSRLQDIKTQGVACAR